MKKVMKGIMMSVCLVGDLMIGRDGWINQQLSQIERYFEAAGFEVGHLAYKDRTFYIDLNVESDEDEMVRNHEAQSQLICALFEEAIEFNASINLGFTLD